MAIFHLSAQVIGRSSGRSVTAAAAYRAAARIVDARTGEIHDFTRKTGVRESFTLAPVSAPAWMRDRARLWNGVEAVEKRKDGQLAREMEVGLPHELSHAARRALLVEFVEEEFVDLGMVADVAMHAPGREGDRRNEHAHILLTLRHIEDEGFGQKAREWNDKGLIEKWRESWARRVNQALEAHAVSSRVDHRSYERQALSAGHDVAFADLPTIHLGPDASAMERRGIRTLLGDVNREVQVVNLELERARRKLIVGAGSQTESEHAPAYSYETEPAIQRERLQQELRQALDLLYMPSAMESRAEIRRKREVLPTILARRIKEDAALSAAARELEEAKSTRRNLGKRQASLRTQGRQLQEQAKRNAAATMWRQSHPVRTWLHDLGLFKTPAAALAGDIAGLRKQWEQAKQEYGQIRMELADAQKREEAAFLVRAKVQAEIELKARQETQEASLRLNQADALVANLEHIEEAEKLTPKLQHQVEAPAPDVLRPVPRLRYRGPTPD